MGKTITMRTITRSLLLSVIGAESLYYGFNIGEKSPKINYKFYSSSSDESRDDMMLEINIWTHDSVLADELADKVEDVMNYRTISKNGCFPTYYLEDRRSPDDTDKSVERRQITYKVENYWKEI